VACAIAEAVIDTIHVEGLQKNSLIVGQYLLTKLMELSKRYPCIGDVRGMGLFLGVEFIEVNKNHLDIIPHTKLCQFLVAFMMKEKVLVSSDGPQNNVIKIKPPLCFSAENADTLIHALEKGLIEALKSGEFI
jgi:4-aminobutyrate aminotransferase-like enzyme